jgi:hypothetical protein
VATYEPTPTPQDYGALRAWVSTQLRRIADTLRAPTVSSVRFDILHAEPARYSDGDVVMADGADWNPGAGGGLYQRFGGAWVKL